MRRPLYGRLPIENQPRLGMCRGEEAGGLPVNQLQRQVRMRSGRF